MLKCCNVTTKTYILDPQAWPQRARVMDCVVWEERYTRNQVQNSSVLCRNAGNPLFVFATGLGLRFVSRKRGNVGSSADRSEACWMSPFSPSSPAPGPSRATRLGSSFNLNLTGKNLPETSSVHPYSAGRAQEIAASQHGCFIMGLGFRVIIMGIYSK